MLFRYSLIAVTVALALFACGGQEVVNQQEPADQPQMAVEQETPTQLNAPDAMMVDENGQPIPGTEVPAPTTIVPEEPEMPANMTGGAAPASIQLDAEGNPIPGTYDPGPAQPAPTMMPSPVDGQVPDSVPGPS